MSPAALESLLLADIVQAELLNFTIPFKKYGEKKVVLNPNNTC